MRENMPLTESAEHLRRVEFLADLSSDLLDELISFAQQLSLEPGEVLFREGDRGDAVYVVVEGAVQIFVSSPSGEELVLAALRAGELIGEHYLFQSEGLGRRGASARASEPTVLLRIEGPAFLEVLTRDPTLAQRIRERRDRREADNLEKRSEMFRLLTSLGAVDPQASARFDSGEIIFHEGDEADAAWLITAGEVCVYPEARPDELLARLGVGQCFGERACVSDARRSATVRALTPLEAIRISREHFVRLHELSPQLRNIVSGLEFVYHLPQRGIALQFFGNQGGEGTIERLYRLEDGRRFLASWVPALKAFRLERVDRADAPLDAYREAAWAEAAIGEPARRRAIRLSQDGRIRSFSAVGEWPEMPQVIEAAIDGEVFGADAIRVFERVGRLGDARPGQSQEFGVFLHADIDGDTRNLDQGGLRQFREPAPENRLWLYVRGVRATDTVHARTRRVDAGARRFAGTDARYSQHCPKADLRCLDQMADRSACRRLGPYWPTLGKQKLHHHLCARTRTSSRDCRQTRATGSLLAMAVRR